VDEATELLAKIARLNGNHELEEFLATPRGHARVRAIHHLSGGNHRLYIVLSEFITRKTLEELTRPFEQMVDEQLTPFFQERLRWLSPQQRKIVEFLCLRSRPVQVKEIAEKLFTTHPTIANQLKQLREMGYVIGHQRGRESLYELAEPLMRLSVQVKDAHAGQPLVLLVEFLRVWYAREELQQRVTGFKEAAPERAYFVAALEKCRSGEPNLRLQFLREEVQHLELERCDVAHLETLKELAEESGKADDWFRYARACCYQARYPEALTSLNHVIETPGTPVNEEAECLILRAETLRQLGRIADAITDYTRVIELPGASADNVAEALIDRGFAYGQKGRTDDAITDYTRIIELRGAPADHVAWALTWRGSAYGEEGRLDEAIADYTRVVELPGAPAESVAEALINRGLAYGQKGRTDDAIADCTRVVQLRGASADRVALALINRGSAYGQKGRRDEAIADYTRVIELPGASADDVAEALNNRGITYPETGRTDDGIADYTRVIELTGAPAEQVARARWNLAQALFELDRWDAAIEQVKTVPTGQGILDGGAASATRALVAVVFRQMGFPEVRRARVDQSVDLYARCDRLPLLGGALVRHLAELAGSTLNQAGLDEWLAGWASAASGHEVMQFPLRLLCAGIDYIKTEPRDEGVLLQLPQEERALVRQALELPPESPQ
jgi:tetratricopeptide (TPR) repeat protein